MDNGDLEKLLIAEVRSIRELLTAEVKAIEKLADEREKHQQDSLKLALAAVNKQSGPSVLISGIIAAAMGAIIAGVVWHALK